MIHILSNEVSLVNSWINELRNVEVQTDRMKFRRNMERIGEIAAFEISKKMKTIHIFLIFIAIGLSSCTVEKTPFGNRLNFTSRGELQEVGYFKKNNHLISIEAPDGEFLRGYNKIAVKISTSNEQDVISEVTFSPSHKDTEGNTKSVPHSPILTPSTKNLYS